MKFTVLTNFDNYESSINCDKFGVITLILKPKFIDNISFHTNFIKKRGSTIFKNKICTLYKKSSNEFLYKYTNHKPRLNNFGSQFVEFYSHNIPTSNKYIYHNLKHCLFKFYYDYKARKSVKLYNKYYLHRF